MHRTTRRRVAATVAVLTAALLAAAPVTATAAPASPGPVPPDRAAPARTGDRAVPAGPDRAVPARTDGWAIPAARAGSGEATGPTLVGAGRLDRANGEDVRFAFDAHGFAWTAQGTFRVSHYDGDEGGWFAGRVDCLIVAGPVAVATGVVTDSTFPELVGVRKGFTVYDHGHHDRVGYSWALDEDSTRSVPLCLSGAPYEKVATGDFRVTEWFPPAEEAEPAG